MKTKHFSFFVASLLAVSIANAAINIDTVLVGDAGNPADPLNSGSVPGIGSVNYNYYISTYEVTNAQYTAFLNSVAATDTHLLYNSNMAGSFGGITRSGTSGSYTYSAISGRENNPVNYVSFWDAARFANWLTNDQPTGAQDLSTTETGMYFLNGVTNPVNNTITRDAIAWANGGVAIASENEWYKAAYYSGSPTGADGDGYWLYPTQSNTISTANANYRAGAFGDVGDITPVGTYAGDASYYGTFDQGGNVYEWNEETTFNLARRGRLGGSFLISDIFLQSSTRTNDLPAEETRYIGFRVTSLQPITETNEVVPVFGLPWLVLLIGSLLGFGYRKIRQS